MRQEYYNCIGETHILFKVCLAILWTAITLANISMIFERLHINNIITKPDSNTSEHYVEQCLLEINLKANKI